MIKGRVFFILLALGSFIPGVASAATMEDLEKQIQEIRQTYERKISDLEREVGELKSVRGAQAPTVAMAEPPDEGEPYLVRKAKELEAKEISPTFRTPLQKPFLRRAGRNTYLGGYMDFEFRSQRNANATFAQKRFIPFIYSDITDQIKMASEIEFEFGGPNNNASNGEVKLEFAFLDYLMRDALNLRAGQLLLPLGKLNLVHDSPLQDLVDRPLVDQFVIPTTLSEPGLGAYGSFYPTDLAKVDYELYIVNGFRGLDANGTSRFNRTTGLRSGRPDQKQDNNDEPAVVGRLAYSPWLGFETGGSLYAGTYDQSGDNFLTIPALDFTWQKGPFEILGEGAYAWVDRDGIALGSGIPQNLWGYYLQGNYHFMPPGLRQRLPNIFRKESTFTAVGRWDQIDLDGNGSQRFTVGLNFRPVEDTVLKADMQFNNENRANEDVSNQTFLLGVASYF